MHTAMSAEMFIGIASRNGAYEVVALENGRVAVTTKFPASNVGIEAISDFLSSCGKRVRLAVAGFAAVSLALALGRAAGRETFIVSADVADQAAELARYAEHAL